MNWQGDSLNSASINDLLSTEGTTLPDVLDDSGLGPAIKANNQLLFNFLLDKRVLDELLDIVLTDIYSGLPNSRSRTRTAMGILVSNTTFMNVLQLSSVFVSRLNTFASSEWSYDPKTCGHFARITEFAVEATGGVFLQKLSSLKPMIIERMHILGIREFFITLSTVYTVSFVIDSLFVRKLIENISSPRGYYIATALKSMLRLKPELSIVISNPESFSYLLDIATNPTLPQQTASEAFNILIKIRTDFLSDEITQMIQEKSHQYVLPDPCKPYLAASAIKLFPTLALDNVDRLFDNPSNSSINQAIMETIVSSDRWTVFKIVKEKNFLIKIAEELPKSKVNAQLTQFAELINSFPGVNRIDKDGKWSEFCKGYLEERTSLRDEPYPPNSSLSDDTSCSTSGSTFSFYSDRNFLLEEEESDEVHASDISMDGIPQLRSID